VSPDVYGFSAGYQFETTLPDLTIFPGASLYLDADDDIVNITNQFDIDGRAPVIVNDEVIGKAKVNDDDWLVGGGLGIGFNATERISAEFSFEEYGDADVLGLALKYRF
jgi:hypothetical protein